MNRNNFQVSSITKDYETARKQLGDEKSPRPLPVHCVSALAFMNLVRGKEVEVMRSGFKTKGDTGIPGLRDALISTTWETRLKSSIALNTGLYSAFARLQKWLEDTTTSFKMTAEERVMLDQRASLVFSSIDESFSRLHITTGNTAEELVDKHLFSSFPKISTKAATKLRKIVTKTTWVSRPIVWSTHRALNKNEGVWKHSRAGLLDWNEQLNGEFVDMIKKEWSQIIHVSMPTVVLEYVKEAEKRLTDFADNLMSAALDILPSLREAFEYLRDSILRNVRRLQVRADSIFADFDAAAKDAWRLVKPTCVDAWMPIYHICGAEQGRGHYACKKATHKTHVEGLGGRLMYRECGRKLNATIRRMCADIHNQFEEKYTEIMEGFMTEMTATLDQHIMCGDRRSNRQKTSLTKVKLQGILPMKIEALYKEWQIDLSNEPKEEKKKPEPGIFDSTKIEEEEEEAIPDVDDLLKDRNFEESEAENDSDSDA